MIRATSLQQIICLCLLDLCLTFDTLDHYILIHRFISWFDIDVFVLSWAKSCLSNRSFYVNLTDIKSSIFQLLFGVPQRSVIGPLLCILYTTQLSHLFPNLPQITSMLVIRSSTFFSPICMNIIHLLRYYFFFE
jgi:Reverse transcriptase (RNA-dependent DNA polymerase)